MLLLTQRTIDRHIYIGKGWGTGVPHRANLTK